MKAVFLIAFFVLASICEISADDVPISPYIVKHVKAKYIKECRREAGLTDRILNEAKRKATKCGSDFSATPEYEHFYMCLETKEGFRNKLTGKLIIEKVYKKWYFYEKAYIDKMLDTCFERFKYVINDNHRNYQSAVCFFMNAGDLPHETKHVAVSNVDAKLIKQCRNEAGWNERQLCNAYTTTYRDAFTGDRQGMVYQTCLLENLGYFQGTQVNRQKVKERFNYISDGKFDQVYNTCVKDFSEKETESVVPEIHKCMKISFGEYPVPVSRMK